MRLKQEYNLIKTRDGSHTLRLKTRTHEESMHSHGGAFSETLYIYSEPFKKIKKTSELSVLSVGLGMGYNELLSVCEFLSTDQFKSLYLESYEKDEFLTLQFLNWINNIPGPLNVIYDQITKLFAEHFGLDPKLITTTLNKLSFLQKIQFKKAIGFTTQFNKKFNIVLYDAFCSRTSPELWDSFFIQYIIDQMQSGNCSFATYARKSLLNKILIENNFTLANKEGFAGKRESTFAYKE